MGWETWAIIIAAIISAIATILASKFSHKKNTNINENLIDKPTLEDIKKYDPKIKQIERKSIPFIIISIIINAVKKATARFGIATFIKLVMSAGIRSIIRAIQYDFAQSKHRPDKSHYYIVCIGVHPDYQGQGYGKKLIEHTHRLSETHPTSAGTGLDTENPNNVALYEHLGYKVVETNNIHGLDMWNSIQIFRLK